MEIRFRDTNTANTTLQLVGTWAPLILLGALWILMIRQIRQKRPPSCPAGGLDFSGGLR